MLPRRTRPTLMRQSRVGTQRTNNVELALTGKPFGARR